MSFDYAAEIFASYWQDITPYVYGHSRADIHISMGRSSESSSYQPTTCSLQLNNRDGRFSPSNPTGPYYGALGVNTPLRITRSLVTAGFGATVSSAWPACDTGEAWTTFGSGGTLNASDYNSSGGLATHSVPAANAYRSTYLATVSLADLYVQCDLKLGITDITGAPVSWNLLLRGQSTSAYHRVAVEVQADESIHLSMYGTSGTQLTTTTVSGITHSSTQTLRLAVMHEGEVFRAKLWVPAVEGEPHDWDLTFYYQYNDIVPGFVGVQSRVDTSNTNSKPLVFSYDNFVVKSMRFFGEVAAWPVQWDVSESDIFVPIEAAGVMRRVGSTDAPIKSPIRAFVPSIADSIDVDPMLYVPMEEGSQAIAGAPDIGRYQVVLFANTKAPSEHWGKGELASWLYNGIALYGDGQIACAINQVGFVPADGWRVDLVVKSTGDQNWTWKIQTGSFQWQVLFKPGTKEVTVTNPVGTATGSATAFFDNAVHNIRLGAYQSGSDISWGFGVDGDQIVGSAITATLQGLSHWYLDSVAPHTGPLSVGHFVAWPAEFGSSSDVQTAVAGFAPEQAVYRMVRLAANEGVGIFSIGPPASSAKMGPQSLSALSSQLDEAERTDMGLLSDARGELGIAYRILISLYNQSPKATLSYTGKQLILPLVPTKDDQLIRNDVTATSSIGQYRYTVDSGPMSTRSPASGGVGRYSAQVSVNPAAPGQLQDVAGWVAHLGTVNEVRYPAICVNLARSQITRGLLFDLMQVGVGDRLQVNNIPSHVGGSTSQIVVGYEEIINRYVQEIRFHGAPESPYEVIEFDDGQSRVQAGDSFLAQSITSSATSIQVSSLDDTRWTNAAASLPIPITIGGEDMSVTAVTNTVPSFVGAGTAAHADNANVTPTIHGSATTGDLMVIMAAIRNTAATPTTPGGWTLMYADGNVRFFGKVHAGSESNPTISFTGGSAGDTTSAQVATFRNVGLTVYQSFSGSNGSTQNISYGKLDCPMVDGLGIIWGWKQDDWTSVATVDAFGWAEIGEPSSTTGNDQGIVWDYKVFAGDVRAPDGTLTVTGGGSATNKGGAFALGNWQTLTVTRSVNGIVKAHTADGSEKTRVVARGRTTVALAED